MIEKRLLQMERLDFSATQYTRKCSLCRDCARLLQEKSIGLLLGLDLLGFYGKSSENLDKSNHLLYNESKQRGKKRPADEVTGTCA